MRIAFPVFFAGREVFVDADCFYLKTYYYAMIREAGLIQSIVLLVPRMKINIYHYV